MLSAVPLLTLFVLDDVLVLLVHDGASEAVLRPERRRKRHCYVPRKRGDIMILILLIRIRSSHFPVGWEYTAQIGYVLVFYLKSSLMFNIDQN